MQLSDVVATLKRVGLHGIADRVVVQSRPCAWIVVGEAGEGPLGASRVGGRPDVPVDAAWPLMPDGTAMTFVMQLALSDPHLPLAGLISLFMGDPDGGYDLPHRLWLTPADTPLKRLSPPAPSEDPIFGALEPHGLDLVYGIDFPRWESLEYRALIGDLTEDEELAYQEDFLWNLEPTPQDRIIGKLCGHVAGIGSDPREDAVAWEQAPDRMYDTVFKRGIRQADGDGVLRRQWTNLLMVDSCQLLDLCIGDAGYLQVMIKDARLAVGDLGQTYAQAESS